MYNKNSSLLRTIASRFLIIKRLSYEFATYLFGDKVTLFCLTILQTRQKSCEILLLARLYEEPTTEKVDCDVRDKCNEARTICVRYLFQTQRRYVAE